MVCIIILWYLFVSLSLQKACHSVDWPHPIGDMDDHHDSSGARALAQPFLLLKAPCFDVLIAQAVNSTNV